MGKVCACVETTQNLKDLKVVGVSADHFHGRVNCSMGEIKT